MMFYVQFLEHGVIGLSWSWRKLIEMREVVTSGHLVICRNV